MAYILYAIMNILFLNNLVAKYLQNFGTNESKEFKVELFIVIDDY